MEWIKALCLAVVQGLTEFIPISSSGHLAILQNAFQFREPPIAFDLVLHIGTLVAVVLFYRRELSDMLRAAGQPESWSHPNAPSDSAGKMLSLIIIASVPTAVIGFVLESRVESAFSDMRSVAIEFILGGMIMSATLLRRRQSRSLSDMRVSDALVIGTLQGISVFPAISRSGSTISAALLLGIRPELAGRFSFLLSIPAILGACLLESKKIVVELQSGDGLALYLVSGAVAGLVGYLSIRPLIRILQSARFHYFAYYCYALGAGLLAYTIVSP